MKILIKIFSIAMIVFAIICAFYSAAHPIGDYAMVNVLAIVSAILYAMYMFLLLTDITMKLIKEKKS